MRLLILFILSFSFYSCQEVEEVKKPDDLISEQKMVDVLTDLSILNAAKNHNKRMLESKGVQPDKFLYEKHDIDSLQFAQSTDYYAKNFDRLEIIYERVKQNLEEVKREYEERQEEEKNLSDPLPTLETDSIRVLPGENSIDTLRRRRIMESFPDTLITPVTSVDI